MGWSREYTEKVTVGAAGSSYISDRPCSAPFKNLTIILSSNGIEYSAGNLEWEVYYHNKWAGTAFASAPVDGVIQSSGLFVLPTDIAHTIFEDTSLMRANKDVSHSPTYPAIRHPAGPKVTLKLNNTTAASLDVYVTFISEVVSEAQ